MDIRRDSITIRILRETKEKLPLLAAMNKETQMQLLRRLVDKEEERVNAKLLKSASKSKQ